MESLVIHLLFCLLSFSSAKTRHSLSDVDKMNDHQSLFQEMIINKPPSYTTQYIEQYIDHFNYKYNTTYYERYLISEVYWEHGEVLFLYTGNEGPIEAFYDNSLFVFELASSFSALVVFAEHRYYGKSLPFGSKDTFKPENMGYLTAEQALADFAVLTEKLKSDYKIKKVIAFGGSYGGMLSAWMRFKYPNVIDGALAASAPIYIVAGLSSPTDFFSKVTMDFENIDKKCPDIVRQAFSNIQDLSKQGESGLAQLTKSLKLCKPMTNDKVHHLIGWVRNSFTMLAMLDYPYPASFLAKLPANPVNVSCQILLEATDKLRGLADAAGLLYNGTKGTLSCYDIDKEFIECADPTGCGLGLDSLSWDYQACTEMTLKCTTNNISDMFPPSEYNIDEYCLKKWGVTKRTEWMRTQYWGEAIETASNIIFSNGDLDPWSTGGVLHDIGDNLIAILIKGGAHHLDLRGTTSDDPPSVTEAREKEKKIIEKWINN